MTTWRATWWYVQSFWKKYRTIFVVSIIVGISLVWLFPRLIVLLPQQKRTEYIGRVGFFSWLEIPADIQEKMSAGLTTIDQSGEPIPTLAERWTVEEDGRVFRFLLRKDLRWQDGKEFTASDVQYNFSDVQIVRTENEVVFRLNDAYAPFPVAVAQPLFRQVQERQFGFLKRSKIIGLGQYRVLSLQYNGPYVKQLVIENDEERLIYRFYATEQDAFVAYEHGKVDRLENMVEASPEVLNSPLFSSVDEQINPRQYVAVYFNTSDPNLVREVRQALNYATRKPGSNDVKLRALSPIAPTSWAYNETNEINPFSYDTVRALELLEKAQLQQPLQLTLDTGVTLLEEAQAVAQDWSELGNLAQQQCVAGKLGKDSTGSFGDCSRFAINVNVRVARDLQNFQAVLIGREVPPDPDQYTWWHSNQASNITQYQNPRVDKLLEDARKETDEQRRKLLYFEFQRYLVEDVPAMFLYYVPEFTIERRNWL